MAFREPLLQEGVHRKGRHSKFGGSYSLKAGCFAWYFLTSDMRTQSNLEPAAVLLTSNFTSFKANLSKIAKVLFDSLEMTNTSSYFSVNSS